MGEYRNVKRVCLGHSTGRRPVGYTRYRWSDGVEADLRDLKPNWREIAQNRNKWRNSFRRPRHIISSNYELTNEDHSFTICVIECLAHRVWFPAGSMWKTNFSELSRVWVVPSLKLLSTLGSEICIWCYLIFLYFFNVIWQSYTEQYYYNHADLSSCIQRN